MILNINGEINEYYIQTLCMLFFPGEKFSATKQADVDSPSATVSVEESVDGITAKVSISHLGKTVERSFFEPFSDSETLDKTRKIAVGKAFFNAGKKLVGKAPQWGILTGVRPAKLALQELMNGATKAEVRSKFTKEYFVNAKKAALACDTAYLEKRLSPPRLKTPAVYIFRYLSARQGAVIARLYRILHPSFWGFLTDISSSFVVI